MPDSMIFRHDSRRLFHGSNFNPSPLIMTKLWNCEEQQSLCPPPNLWGVRDGGGPISNTWPHTVHSHDHPITEWCNPNYCPTQRFYISPRTHWGANSKDEENHNWRHYVPAYQQTDRPTNQHICRHFCQQHADCLCQQALPISYGRLITTFKNLQLNPTARLFWCCAFRALSSTNSQCSTNKTYHVLPQIFMSYYNNWVFLHVSLHMGWSPSGNKCQAVSYTTN